MIGQICDSSAHSEFNNIFCSREITNRRKFRDRTGRLYCLPYEYPLLRNNYVSIILYVIFRFYLNWSVSHFVQGLEATLSDSKKRYGDKVNALLSAWEHVTNYIPAAPPEAIQSLIEWAHRSVYASQLLLYLCKSYVHLIPNDWFILTLHPKSCFTRYLLYTRLTFTRYTRFFCYADYNLI